MQTSVWFDGRQTIDSAQFAYSVQGFFPGVEDIPAARAVLGYYDRLLIGVQNPSARLYMFDSTSLALDDGDLVLKPDDLLPLQPGRWLKLSSGGATTFTALTDCPPIIVPLQVVRGNALGTALEFFAPSITQCNYTAIVDPTVNDDSSIGYSVGSFWVNTLTKIAYICVDASVGAADWMPLTTTSNVEVVRTTFNFASASPVVIANVLAGQVVIDSEIEITIPFDDPAAKLKLGTSIIPDVLIPDDYNIPQTSGVYRNDCNYVYPVNNVIQLTITPGSSIQGSGAIVCQIKRS